MRSHRRSGSSPWIHATALLLTVVGAAAGLRAQPEPLPGTRPDILLVIADDMDYDHFGFRSPAAHTPTLDMLAAGGCVIERAWMAPKCAPSLAAILTGQHPHENGRFYNRLASGAEIPLDHTETFVRYLDNAGYNTYCGGKWWEAEPTLLGFDAAQADQANFVRNGQNHLLEWLDGVPPDESFFIWWAPLLPHLPHNPRQHHLDLIDPARIVVPDYIAEADRAEFIQKEHVLLAMTAWLDEGLEELLDHLHMLGRRENLLVVVCIDNGWSNGRVSKGSLYEKGMQSPLIFTHATLVPPGTSRRELASIVDIHPTILDFAGVQAAPRSDGLSLRPIIEGRSTVWRTRLIEAAYPGIAYSDRWTDEVYGLAVRTDRFKFIGYLRDVREEDNYILRIHHILAPFPRHLRNDQELFDLSTDRVETANLASLPGYESTVLGYRSIIRDWWRRNIGPR